MQHVSNSFRTDFLQDCHRINIINCDGFFFLFKKFYHSSSSSNSKSSSSGGGGSGGSSSNSTVVVIVLLLLSMQLKPNLGQGDVIQSTID